MPDEMENINRILSQVAPEELEKLDKLLIKLGLKPDPHKATKHRKEKLKGELTTQNLKVIYTCQTCKQSYQTIFVMEASKDGLQRISKEFREPVDLYCHKTRIEKVKWCDKCERYLMNLTKEQVIAMFMKVLKEGK